MKSVCSSPQTMFVFTWAGVSGRYWSARVTCGPLSHKSENVLSGSPSADAAPRSSFSPASWSERPSPRNPSWKYGGASEGHTLSE